MSPAHIPVLFLVMGRSGSSNAWMTLSKLAGGEMNEVLEVVRSKEYEVEEFFSCTTYPGYVVLVYPS